MGPYLVDGLKGPDLANIATTAPHEARRAVSAQVATTLTDLMIDAEQVTQQKGAIAGVQIASKTGTAEHGTDPRNTPPHAWYIAFAPAWRQRLRLPSSWNTVVTVCMPPAGHWPHPSGAPPSRQRCGGIMSFPKTSASEDRSEARARTGASGSRGIGGGPERVGVEP